MYTHRKALSLATAIVGLLVVLWFPRFIRAKTPQSAQDSASRAGAVIKSNARLVTLDVVVTDRSGKPVISLTKDDFVVLEDGQPQRIANFESPSTHLATSSPLHENGTANTSASPRVQSPAASLPETIIVLDELATSSEDMSFGWQELVKFLRRQPITLSSPTAIMALTKRRLEKIAEPTQNSALLLEKAQKIALELPSHENGVQGAADMMVASLLALDEIALSTADRQTRKNVIWIGSGFPILSSQNVTLNDRERFLSYVRYTANWLQETRTTIYTIDPKGLPVALTAYGSEFGSTFFALGASLTPGELIFENIAPATGGQIYRNRNDLDVAIQSAATNGQTYYTLAYYPSNTDFDGQFRNIKVRLEPPNLTAATQQGYYAIDEGFVASGKDLDFALSRAVKSPLPFSSVQFDALGKVLHAEPSTVRFTFSVERASLSWSTQPNGDQRSEITLVSTELSKSQAILGYKVRELEIIMAKDKLENSPDSRAMFSVTVPLPAKTDHFRFVIRDTASGRMGTFDSSRQGLG